MRLLLSGWHKKSLLDDKLKSSLLREEVNDLAKASKKVHNYSACCQCQTHTL